MNPVDDYLERARSGYREQSFFGLLELEDDPIPALQVAYRNEFDPALRALIVQIVWQRRQPTSLDFLAEALSDPHPETWKQALDGLVSLGTPESQEALKTAIDGPAGLNARRRAWIAEALDQTNTLSDNESGK